MLEIRHLKTLIALRDTGSLVEAAERVHLTQSALSHQIKDLEDKLNCSLFIRKTKPVTFTNAGHLVLSLADALLPMVRQTEREIERLADGEIGSLHICIECHSCFDWLMPTLNQFRQTWPDVDLDLSTGFNFAPLPALARGDLDLVITSDPEPRADITYMPLFSYESVLVMASQHPLTAKAYILPQHLTDLTLITYPIDHSRLDVFTRFLDPAGIQPSTRTAELTVMILQLVASGRGVSALPNWAIQEYRNNPYITSRQLGEKGLWCTLYAAIRTDQAQTHYINDFIHSAKDICFKTLSGIQLV